MLRPSVARGPFVSLASLSRSCLAALLLAGAAAAAVAPPGGVAPSQGSVGTVITIDGAGFGTRLPKVKLSLSGLHPKTFALKVLTFSDSQVTARVKNAPAGVYDVVVKPATKGAASSTYAAAFEMRAPLVMSVKPPAASVHETVAVHGQFFGTAKGVVRIGTAKAKITGWSDTSIAVVVPGKLKSGTYDVSVKNSVGSMTLASALVVGGIGPVDHGTFAATVDGIPMAAAGPLPVLGFVASGASKSVILAAALPGATPRQIQIVLPFDPAAGAPASIVADPAGWVRLTNGGSPLDADTLIWSTAEGGSNDYAVQLQLDATGVLTGSFTANPQRVQGSGPASVAITAGSFRVVLPH